MAGLNDCVNNELTRVRTEEEEPPKIDFRKKS